MSSDDLSGYAILGFGAGVYLFFKGFRVYRKYRVLADTPEIPIRSVAMGLAEIHGKAKGEDQIYSPLSHTPCYFYKVEIEKYVKDSRGRGRWSHQATDLKGVRFYLQDTSGKVLVDLQGAEFDLPESSKREIGSGTDLSFGRVFRGGERNDPALGIGATDSDLLNYVASVRSGIVLPRIVSSSPPAFMAGGAASDSTDPETQTEAQRELEIFQQQMRARRAIQNSGGGLTSVFNVLRGGGLSLGSIDSGRFRLTEYCVAPDCSYDLTGTCSENPQPRDEDDRNMIVKGENEPTFLISSRSEPELEGSLRWRALRYIFGGGALAVACLGVLLAKLGWL